jgi:hypothetical protein
MKKIHPSLKTIIGWPLDLENHEKSFLLDEQKQKGKYLSSVLVVFALFILF